MGKLVSPFLTEVQIETEEYLGEEVLQRVQLTFEVGSELESEGTEHVAAWIEFEERSGDSEFYALRRHVQRYRRGQPTPEPSEPITLAEVFDKENGSHRLREFLYLWTRDKPGEERVQPLLQENLQVLRRCNDRERNSDALASAIVYMYDLGGEEVLRYMGNVSTRADLRQVILELPTDCYAFEIHLRVSGRIIGNAEYRVIHDLDPVVGKRRSIFPEEYGSCEGMLKIFSDLYIQVDPTADGLLNED